MRRALAAGYRVKGDASQPGDSTPLTRDGNNSRHCPDRRNKRFGWTCANREQALYSLTWPCPDLETQRVQYLVHHVFVLRQRTMSHAFV